MIIVYELDEWQQVLKDAKTELEYCYKIHYFRNNLFEGR